MLPEPLLPSVTYILQDVTCTAGIINHHLCYLPGWCLVLPTSPMSCITCAACVVCVNVDGYVGMLLPDCVDEDGGGTRLEQTGHVLLENRGMTQV